MTKLCSSGKPPLPRAGALHCRVDRPGRGVLPGGIDAGPWRLARLRARSSQARSETEACRLHPSEDSGRGEFRQHAALRYHFSGPPTPGRLCPSHSSSSKTVTRNPSSADLWSQRPTDLGLWRKFLLREKVLPHAGRESEALDVLLAIRRFDAPLLLENCAKRGSARIAGFPRALGERIRCDVVASLELCKSRLIVTHCAFPPISPWMTVRRCLSRLP